MALDLGGSGLNRTSLREQSRELLRARIIDGTIPPGQHLVETALSEQLQISRGTLREALRHLEQEGLVVSDARGRMRVRVLTPRDIIEVYEVRTALETVAATAAAQAPERQSNVRELLDAMEPLRAPGTPLADTIEHDLAFHRRLCELSGNQTLLDTWTHLLSRIRASIVAAGPTVAPGLATWERHKLIVDAIETGEETLIRDVLHRHMTEASSRIARAAEPGTAEDAR